MTLESEDYVYVSVLASGVLTFLKLAGAFDLSWWAVTSPVWGGFLLYLLGQCIYLIVTEFIRE